MELSFEDFSKIDMRVGKIVDAQNIPQAKKLLKLAIDIGDNTKQCIAGIADIYTPEDLKGKLLVVVTNLKPRKVFGLVSEVMVLAALDGTIISIIQPDKTIKPGSKIS